VIDTATNEVGKIDVGNYPFGVAVSPDGGRVCVSNYDADTVLVIDASTIRVTATVPVGTTPYGDPHGLATDADESKVYVANYGDGTVSVIDTATYKVTATIRVGSFPFGVAVTPDGGKVYVANSGDNDVSVISTGTNTVTAKIAVGNSPVAFGVFIQPPSRFAGTPGKESCCGRSVAALVHQFRGLAGASEDLGFPTVRALKNAVLAFCRE
jgi:YVTN family beta-propeller protein